MNFNLLFCSKISKKITLNQKKMTSYLESQAKAKEDFFKTALNEETEVDSLLAFYRQKIAHFEAERFEWMSRFEQLKLSQEEKHKQEWDIKRSKNEIADLQRALSEARVKLFEEKQTLMKVAAEKLQLEKILGDNKLKIGELMSVCSPVEQKVVLSKGQKPSKSISIASH